MRKINTRDTFNALTLINVLKVREEVKEMFNLYRSGSAVKLEEVGLDFFLNILSRVSSEAAQNAFYTFVAGPLEMSKEDIANADPFELFELLKECAALTGKERWNGFFKFLGRMMTADS